MGSRANVMDVDGEEFSRLLREERDVTLVDVRSSAEYSTSHIAGALHINIMDPHFGKRVEMLDRDVPVLLYCRSGSRSRFAGVRLSGMGFKRVYNLANGLYDWREALTKE